MALSNHAADYPSPTSQYHDGTPVGSIILQETASAPPVVTAFETSDPSTRQASATATAQSHGVKLSLGVGLGLIPIILLIIGMYVFALFWYRRHHSKLSESRNAEICDGPISTFPEKTSVSDLSSRQEDWRDDQTPQNMNVSWTTQHGSDSYRSQSRSVNSSASGRTGTIHIKMAAARFNSATSIESSMDSPIDRNNPFRLKQGNAAMRESFCTELGMPWPTPPSTTRSKRSTLETLLTPLSPRARSIDQQR